MPINSAIFHQEIDNLMRKVQAYGVTMSNEETLLLSDRNTEIEIENTLNEMTGMTLDPNFKLRHEQIRRTAARFYTEARLGEREVEQRLERKHRLRSVITIPQKLVEPYIPRCVAPLSIPMFDDASSPVVLNTGVSHAEVNNNIHTPSTAYTGEPIAEIIERHVDEMMNMLTPILRKKKSRGKGSRDRHNIARMLKLRTSFL